MRRRTGSSASKPALARNLAAFVGADLLVTAHNNTLCATWFKVQQQSQQAVVCVQTKLAPSQTHCRSATQTSAIAWQMQLEATITALHATPPRKGSTLADSMVRDHASTRRTSRSASIVQMRRSGASTNPAAATGGGGSTRRSSGGVDEPAPGDHGHNAGLVAVALANGYVAAFDALVSQALDYCLWFVLGMVADVLALVHPCLRMAPFDGAAR